MHESDFGWSLSDSETARNCVSCVRPVGVTDMYVDMYESDFGSVSGALAMAFGDARWRRRWRHRDGPAARFCWLAAARLAPAAPVAIAVGLALSTAAIRVAARVAASSGPINRQATCDLVPWLVSTGLPGRPTQSTHKHSSHSSIRTSSTAAGHSRTFPAGRTY